MLHTMDTMSVTPMFNKRYFDTCDEAQDGVRWKTPAAVILFTAIASIVKVAGDSTVACVDADKCRSS